MKDTIHDIAWGNKLKEMKKLIAQGVDINKKDEEFGNTPLNTAIAKMHDEMALFLLKHGADPRIKDNEGLNALHYATGNGMTNVAKEILEKSPETLNVTDKNEATPLWKAVHYPKTPLDFIEYLLQKGADKAPVLPLVEAFEEKELTQLFERY